MRKYKALTLAAALVPALAATRSSAQSPPTLTLNRTEYASRLRGMWLGETIANWTGLTTEALRQTAPFYTDADWQTNQGRGGQRIDYVLQSPWGADDDTDIEYMYVHLLNQHQTTHLSPQQISNGWKQHTWNDGSENYLWASNQIARDLLDRGVKPGTTSIPAANVDWLMIDAQLTTEVFGALAPGRPDVGLSMGLLPMLTTSRSHATHASQYFAAMYGLAPLVPANLTNAQKARWLSDEARKFIPDSSKAADIIDFVTADFDATPDKNDWEQTRDKIYQRYHAEAAANGFKYRNWFESSVNLATGVMALLYGEGDFKQTVKVGTLSGWDSDNPTASLGGLLGLVHGDQGIIDAMGPDPVSDNYKISRTRINFPDYTPLGDGHEDTFTLLSDRMLDIVDRAVIEAGGQVNGDTWSIPLVDRSDSIALSPTQQMHERSANVSLREQGKTVIALSSVINQPSGSNYVPAIFADGVEHDFSGVEPGNVENISYTTYSAASQPGQIHTLSVLYGDSVEIDTVRFIEGYVAGTNGGWFDSITVELLVEGVWQTAPTGTVMSEALNSAVPFQSIDFTLPQSIAVDGIRISGAAGGTQGWVSIAELDAFRAVPEPAGLAAILAGSLVLRRRLRAPR